MNFTAQEVAMMCAKYGPQVGPLPAGVDGAQLIWAMSGVESSHGTNCTPRHEPAFDVGGVYGSHAPMPALLALYGSPAAARSYGPLQIMLCNANGASPATFDDVDQAFAATIPFLNAQLRHFQPQTLGEIACVWNGGSLMKNPGPGILAYAANLAKAYEVEMPEQLTAAYAVPIPERM